MSDATAAAAAELDSFSAPFENTPETPAAAAVETPVATATPPNTEAVETPAAVTPVDPWAEVDNHPDLPPSLRGKSRREIYDTNLRAIAIANQAGLQKNDAERRALIAEATLNVLRQQAQQAPPPPELLPHQQFGLQNPDDAYAQLPQVLNRIPDLSRQISQNEVQRAVAPLAQQVRQLQDAATFSQAESARSSAGKALNIDPETWDSVKLSVASIMQANNLDPRQENSWKVAGEAYRQSAARLFPQTVSMQAGAPPAGNSKPNATPPSGGTKKKATTGDARMDSQLRDYLESFNRGGTNVKFDDVVASINGDPMRRAEAE